MHDLVIQYRIVRLLLLRWMGEILCGKKEEPLHRIAGHMEHGECDWSVPLGAWASKLDYS